MLERERQTLILKLVNERSIVSVTDLVELLSASEATVRRDLNAMAERGEVRRIRGGVEAMRPRLEAHLIGRPFAVSQDLRVAQKRAIARAAAELLAPDDSVIINGGTTTFALAEFLAEPERDILTNSFPLAAKLLATSKHRITLPAGQLYREQNIVLSPFLDDGIGHFSGGKLFTGCYGINRFGVMEADPLIMQATAKLLERAEEVIVLADSTKLRQKSSTMVMALGRVSALVTDEEARPKEIEALEKAGLKVIVAAPMSEGDEVAA